MIPKCKKFYWNVKKKKIFVNTFTWVSTNFTLRLFPFFRPSFSRLLSRSRKLSRLKDFRSELDWLFPLAFHFNPRKSPGATEMDSVIALPALRIAHPRANWSRKTPTRWTLSWKGRRKRKRKRKKKMEKEKQEKREKEGRKRNSGSWLGSSEKEEASAMNCRAFVGGKMARRCFAKERRRVNGSIVR